MNRGADRYQRMMAALDEAGITANIVRIGPGHFELHVNYEIVKAARIRRTCNRYLTRLINTHIPPPQYVNHESFRNHRYRIRISYERRHKAGRRG